MILYDAHTHLNDLKLYGQANSLIKEFAEAGGKGLVNVGVDMSRNKRAVEIAKNNKTDVQVGAAIGFHPEVAIKNSSIDIKALLSQLQAYIAKNTPYIWAIGEIGIDLYRDKQHQSLKTQQALFEAQLQLAQELNLGVVIHSRDSFEQTWEILQSYKNLKIYFHSWTYTPQQLKQILDYNTWVGFNWILTYPKAEEVRESLKITPLQKILMETDAPYLAPQPQRGKTNKPSFVKYTYLKAASIKGLDELSFSIQIEKNFKNFYELQNLQKKPSMTTI